MLRRFLSGLHKHRRRGKERAVADVEIFHRRDGPALATGWRGAGFGEGESQGIFALRGGQQTVNDLRDFVRGSERLRARIQARVELGAITKHQHARQGESRRRIIGYGSRRTRLGDGAVEVALAEFTCRAQRTGLGRLAGLLQCFHRGGKLTVVSVAHGGFRPCPEIFRREGAARGEFFVALQRTGPAHGAFDETENAQHGWVVIAQFFGRVDLQPRHTVVGFLEIRFGLGGQVPRPPTGEKVITHRADHPEQKQRHGQQAKPAQQNPAKTCFFSAGSHARGLFAEKDWR